MSDRVVRALSVRISDVLMLWAFSFDSADIHLEVSFDSAFSDVHSVTFASTVFLFHVAEPRRRQRAVRRPPNFGIERQQAMEEKV